MSDTPSARVRRSVKQIIVENEAARSAENDYAPDPVHEVGHSGEEATGGVGTENTATPEIRWDGAELLNGDGDEVLRTASFEGPS